MENYSYNNGLGIRQEEIGSSSSAVRSSARQALRCFPAGPRAARAVVNVVLAVLAAEPVDAGAVVVPDAVRAVAVVLARVGAALVVVYLAVLTQKS